ncbi:MAG: hybrid sensor histidine kinase/response regulator [Anaerolineae bacterium]|nr:hybrid sensor histidine kinase/response regulator [Anaerolineae bacterium]
MSKKILYIEDNQANRMLVSQVLAGAGFTVIEAIDGLSGIQMAREEKPDLILMDINIPGIDGHEAATRIKSLPEMNNTPIVAVTARVMAGDRERALTAGCDGYIAKPIDVDRLPQQVSEFLGGMRETITVEQESAYLREYNERLVSHLEEKVEELTQANEALKHTDTMKSRFISLAAHELRTPVAAVYGYLSLLTTPGTGFLAEADGATREIVEGMVTSVDRLRGLIQDMLDITRIEAGNLQLSYAPVQLAQIFQKISKEFAPITQKRDQTLVIDEVSNIPPMWVDGERVTQILRNLVSNAVKYTPNEGEIRVKAEFIDKAPLTELPAQASIATQFVKIVVIDKGVGVPQEQQERIFTNFYEVREIEHHSTSKTDFMGGGAGLGLPIARGVAEAHGGSLWVESEGFDPHNCPGSKFHLLLPLGAPPH